MVHIEKTKHPVCTENLLFYAPIKYLNFFLINVFHILHSLRKSLDLPSISLKMVDAPGSKNLKSSIHWRVSICFLHANLNLNKWPKALLDCRILLYNEWFVLHTCVDELQFEICGYLDPELKILIYALKYNINSKQWDFAMCGSSSKISILNLNYF